MKNKIALLFAVILLAAWMSACAPGTGGMSGANPIDGVSGTVVDEDTGASGPANLPGVGTASGIDGPVEAPGDDGGGSTPPANLPEGATNMPGRTATEPAGTSVGNPEESPIIPVEENGTCMEEEGFVLISPVIMFTKQLSTISAYEKAFILVPKEGDAFISVTFFFPPFFPTGWLITPSKRLERWVRTQDLGVELDFVSAAPLPTMSGEIDGKLVIAATRGEPRYVLLRGDPDLVRTIRITTEESLRQPGRSKPSFCGGRNGVELIDESQAPSAHDAAAIKDLRELIPERTLRMRTSPKK